jgi:predicted GNAT family acetyltransferase
MQKPKQIMNIDKSTLLVENDVAKRRFVIAVEGQKAVLEYMISGEKIIFTHTEVPRALEGNGLGGVLAKAGLGYAKEQGLKVMPLCPYMASYINRHPEWKALLLPGFSVG